jgi:hypothetical protein
LAPPGPTSHTSHDSPNFAEGVQDEPHRAKGFSQGAREVQASKDNIIIFAIALSGFGAAPVTRENLPLADVVPTPAPTI